MRGTALPAPPRTDGRRYAFLATPRWLGLIAVMVAASVACVLLGLWQWDRHAERSAAVDQVLSAYDAEPVPVSQVLGDAGRVGPEQEWRPVELQGRYVEGATVLLRNRPVSGTPAVHVVTPFVGEVDGTQVLVVVDRGWLPADAGMDTDAAVPAPPAGEVALVGRLRTPEAPFDREPPAGQTYTLDPGQVLEASASVTDVSAARALPALAGYVQVVEHSPDPAAAPEAFPRPDTDLGPHLSYAFQWWVFAVGALVGLVFLARREAYDSDDPVDDPVMDRPRRRRTAEDEEDALVDAQLGENGPPSRPV